MVLLGKWRSHPLRWDPSNKLLWGLEQPGCSPGVSSSPATVHKGSGGVVVVPYLQVDACLAFGLASWRQRLSD